MASREERFLMRQRGAGRQLQADDDDFMLALPGASAPAAHREERFLMRQRGAGRQLQGNDNEFMPAPPGATVPPAVSAALLATEALAVNSTDPEQAQNGLYGDSLPGTAAQRALNAKRLRRSRSLTPRQQVEKDNGEKSGGEAEMQATRIAEDGVVAKKRRVQSANGLEVDPTEEMETPAQEEVEDREEEENDETERQTSQLPASSGKKRRKRRSIGQQSTRKKRPSTVKSRAVDPTPMQVESGEEETTIGEKQPSVEIEEEQLEMAGPSRRERSQPPPQQWRGKARKSTGPNRKIDVADIQNSPSDDEQETQAEVLPLQEESIPVEAVDADNMAEGQYEDTNGFAAPDYATPATPDIPNVSGLVISSRDVEDDAAISTQLDEPNAFEQAYVEPELDQDQSESEGQFVTPATDDREFYVDQDAGPNVEPSFEQDAADAEDQAHDVESTTIVEPGDQLDAELAEAAESHEPKKRRGRPSLQGMKRKKRKSVMLPKKKRTSDVASPSIVVDEPRPKPVRKRRLEAVPEDADAQDPPTADTPEVVPPKKRGRPPKTLKQYELQPSDASLPTRKKPGRPAIATEPQHSVQAGPSRASRPTTSLDPPASPPIQPRANTIPIRTCLLTTSDFALSSLQATSSSQLPPLLPPDATEKPVPTAPEVLAQVSSEIVDSVLAKMPQSDIDAGVSSKASRRRRAAVRIFGDELVRRLREMGRMLKANGAMARRIKHGRKLRKELLAEVLEVRAQKEDVDERVFQSTGRLDLARRVRREDERILEVLGGVEEGVKMGGVGAGGGGTRVGDGEFELRMLMLQRPGAADEGRDGLEDRASQLGRILERVVAS